MQMTQNLYHSQGNLSAVISRIFKTTPDSSLFRKSFPNQSHFPKKSQFRNYEVQARELWPRIISKMKEGIHIDDIKSSEPFLGSSLFMYGWKKSPKPRFSIITIKS